MKQVVLSIPDKKYAAFISLIKRKFEDVSIKELSSGESMVMEEEGVYETSLLSEKALSEDWLSEEDNRWDNGQFFFI